MINETKELRVDLWGISGFTLISFEHYLMGAFFIFISIIGCIAISKEYK